jgi:hypothetical protein
MAKISFAGVEVRSFEPLPVGRYLGKVSSAEYVEASNRSGEPTIRLEFVVTGGDYDGPRTSRIGAYRTEAVLRHHVT